MSLSLVCCLLVQIQLHDMSISGRKLWLIRCCCCLLGFWGVVFFFVCVCVCVCFLCCCWWRYGGGGEQLKLCLRQGTYSVHESTQAMPGPMLCIGLGTRLYAYKQNTLHVGYCVQLGRFCPQEQYRVTQQLGKLHQSNTGVPQKQFQQVCLVDAVMCFTYRIFATISYKNDCS